MKAYDGIIISCDRDGSVHRYLVEDKGRIVFVGDVLPAEYRGAPIEPLGAGSLLTAFGDTHLHFMSYALFHAGLDVRSAGSVPQLCERVREFASASHDGIIMGFGASPHSVEERRLVLRDELDEACPDRAVFLVKYDGHACILNSRTIGMLPGRIRRLRGYIRTPGR